MSDMSHTVIRVCLRLAVMMMLGVSALMAGVYIAIRCAVACSGVESDGTLVGLRRELATITEQTVSKDEFSIVSFPFPLPFTRSR